jgi:hypothetical protein
MARGRSACRGGFGTVKVEPPPEGRWRRPSCLSAPRTAAGLAGPVGMPRRRGGWRVCGSPVARLRGLELRRRECLASASSRLGALDFHVSR